MIVVIGAGVVGLAIAARLSKNHEVIVLESHDKFGQETSSRNSEVIHSGIYYPKESLKTSLCIRGRELLYAFAKEHQVPHRRCGKLVIATSEAEIGKLEKLWDHARACHVPCEKRTGKQIRDEEPLVVASAGLFFPESGIVDSHAFMAALEREALSRNASFAYRHSVRSIEKTAKGWKVSCLETALDARHVINTAGLAAAELSNLTLGTRQYEQRYCRGKYFALKSSYQNAFHHLIYPIPETHGLGVHVTLDMAGLARLGPDVDWCVHSRYEDRASLYECDWEKERKSFLEKAQRYCPTLAEEDLTPGLIGIRPKLFLNGQPHQDFLMENFGGYIHCLGIESPGLTAALAISEQVEKIL